MLIKTYLHIFIFISANIVPPSWWRSRNHTVFADWYTLVGSHGYLLILNFIIQLHVHANVVWYVLPSTSWYEKVWNIYKMFWYPLFPKTAIDREPCEPTNVYQSANTVWFRDLQASRHMYRNNNMKNNVKRFSKVACTPWRIYSVVKG
jgi:hypothetical protein